MSLNQTKKGSHPSSLGGCPALQKKFIRKHFKHFQLLRDGNVALYEREPIDGTTGVHYEVIIIRTIKEQNINGSIIPAREKYPTAREWGLYGWTHIEFRKATIHYKEKVIENQASKNK